MTNVQKNLWFMQNFNDQMVKKDKKEKTKQNKTEAKILFSHKTHYDDLMYVKRLKINK